MKFKFKYREKNSKGKYKEKSEEIESATKDDAYILFKEIHPLTKVQLISIDGVLVQAEISRNYRARRHLGERKEIRELWATEAVGKIVKAEAQKRIDELEKE